MLRRSQLKTDESEGDVLDLSGYPSEPPARNRRAGDASRPQAAAEEAPVERRRGGDRRGMDALRSEALKALIERVEDRNFGGLRNTVQWKPKLKGSRFLLLAVSLIAGGIAAVLATQASQPNGEPVRVEQAEPVVEVVPEPRVQILVAREAIAAGQRLSENSVGWEDWPEASLRPEYLSFATAPDAMTAVAGTVARFALFPGEPIRSEKLIAPGEGGFLASVLEAGKRAVSVAVAAETASGGFIVANDRVDVVLTRASEAGTQISETLISDVRVLAIGGELGPAAAPSEEMGEQREQQQQAFSGATIATLELDSVQAEVVMSAMALGRLSLTLRSTGEAQTAAPLPANQLIRLTSPFWRK